MSDAAWEGKEHGLSVRVRVTPRGGRDAIDGSETLADGSSVVKIRVRAAPEDGAANEAVRRLLAKSVGVPASAVTITAGATSRVKTLAIRGVPGTLAAALAGLCGEAQAA